MPSTIYNKREKYFSEKIGNKRLPKRKKTELNYFIPPFPKQGKRRYPTRIIIKKTMKADI